ncbi:MAG: beta-galactosidase [Chloroflexi bacterium]|nr:beta-galactosidase [Chloroflexota bacterium]
MLNRTIALVGAAVGTAAAFYAVGPARPAPTPPAPPAASSEDALPVHFSHPELVRYDHQAFTVRGRDVYLFSGCFHYFRCPPELWNDRLDKIAAAGFNTIETYVAWNFHEPRPGKADLRQLDEFLTACEHHHLWVIVRPGPYICAEWDVGGLPRWLAAQHPGFRTDSPLNERWSRYWYDEVLPVIRRHQITRGGSVILMQLENEYDYSGLPAEVEANYIKALYADAVQDGIDIPLITCWTKVARRKSDPIMSQLLDASNFYPGWGIDGTLGAINAMKTEEPESPPMVTELQGGWFSDVGQKSTREPGAYGPDQVNALTRSVMAHGVAASSYYMVYGGTNFGYWGSRGRTTSYDYTAPIAEPGGLWDKYRSVKLIGDFVRIAGSEFVRMPEVPGGATTTTPGVQVLLRARGQQGVLFIRNTTTTPVVASVLLPGIPGASALSAPLGARDARFLLVHFPAAGTVIHSNVELSDAVSIGGRPVVVGYGAPGDQAAMEVDGQVVEGKIDTGDQLIPAGRSLAVLTSQRRAGTTREFDQGADHVLALSDSYFIKQSALSSSSLNLEVRALPGDDPFTLVSPRPVRRVQVDGARLPFHSESVAGVTRFTLSTPALPFAPVVIDGGRARADLEAPARPFIAVGTTADGSLKSLDQMGQYDDGYSVYSGTVSVPESGRLQMRFYDSDWHSVYLDGRLVPSLTGSSTAATSPAEASAIPGTHRLRVVYENEGRPNIGFMEQEKGIRLVRPAPTDGTALREWKMAPDAAARGTRRAPQAQTAFNDESWDAVTVGNGPQSYFHNRAVSAWFRTHLQVTQAAIDQKNLELDFDGVDDNATVFVNGRFAVMHRGWDERPAFVRGGTRRRTSRMAASTAGRFVMDAAVASRCTSRPRRGELVSKPLQAARYPRMGCSLVA